MRARLALALTLWPLLAGAADLQPGDRPIPPEEWRALTEGRTVTYTIGGRLWGREFFHPGGERATFLGADGACMTAPWAYAEGLYCFGYGGLHCFRHVRRDGDILILPEGGGPEQAVEGVETAPISCDAPLSS